jgi:hypothetical protein
MEPISIEEVTERWQRLTSGTLSDWEQMSELLWIGRRVGFLLNLITELERQVRDAVYRQDYS